MVSSPPVWSNTERDWQCPPVVRLLHGRVRRGPQNLRGKPSDQRPVLLCLGELRHPLRVSQERIPLLLPIREALVGQDVKQLVIGPAELVGSEPDDLYVVFGEEPERDVRKPFVQVRHPTWHSRIRAELIQHGRALLWVVTTC